MITPLVVLTAYFTSSAYGYKLHEHMTNEEIQSVFSVKHDAVHAVDYEVVPVLHNSGVGQNAQVRFSAFNTDYNLFLEKNNHILLGSNTKLCPAWRLSNGEIFYNYAEFPLPEKLQLYHDVKKRAAIALYTDEDDKVHAQGLVGDNIIIRSLPPRVHKEVLSKYPNISKNNDLESESTTHHIVIRSLQDYNEPGLVKYVTQVSTLDANDKFDGPTTCRQYEPKIVQLNSILQRRPNLRTDEVLVIINESINRINRQVTIFDLSNNLPFYESLQTSLKALIKRASKYIARDGLPVQLDTVYPQLLIAADYDTYLMHNSDEIELAKYMAAFWNAVDLRFREMDNPKIRLNIASLIVSKDPSISFMGNHPENRCPGYTNALNSEDSLDSIGKFFSSDTVFSKDAYDIAIGMTNRQLCGINATSLQYIRIAGQAPLAGACNHDEGKATVLTSDRGSFAGVLTAAHELAHSLGAPHDGIESKDVEGGPCAWEDGYIMSYVRTTRNKIHMSECSKTAIRKYLNTDDADCLRNKPDVGTPYPKVLPGKLQNREQQCQASQKTSAYTGPDQAKANDCLMLYCGLDYPIYAHVTPAEGSSCGSNKICLDGICVRDPEIQG